MATYRLSMADENLIEQITDTDELTQRIPRLNTFFEGVQEMKQLQKEISTLGRFTKKSGFDPGRNFQRVATIPYSIAHTIWHIDPDFWSDKAKVYRFLKAHPEYDTRTKVD